MNDPHDEKVDELFDRIRRIEPPIETRIASREAVAAELKKQEHSESPKVLPIWKRSVAVPIPVLAASLALMLALVASVSRNASTATVDRDDQAVNENVVSPLNENDKSDVVEPVQLLSASSPVQVAYRGSTVYLCGIGPLRTESRSFIEE